MANEFIIKNGFHSKGNSQVTGSLDVSSTLTVGGSAVGAAFPFVGDAQITGSLTISGSFNAFTLNSDDLVLGIEAGDAMIGGSSYNVFLGRRAGSAVTDGDANVIIGNEAGYLGNQSHNTSVGYLAGRGWNTAGYNVCLGHSSGYGAATTAAGKYNTLLGAYTGRNLTSGTGNIYLGYYAGYEGAANTGNIIIGSGSLGAPAYATPISNQLRIGHNSTHIISGSLETGEVIGRWQRPIETHTADFSISASAYIGTYNIVGGNFTCSIQTGSLPAGAEFEFFQTSSVGNFLFTTASNVSLIVKNNNLNLAGQGSGASLKYISGDTFHLVGDLT